MSLIVNDRLSFPRDSILMPDEPQGLWAKTEVIGGYGDFKFNPTGKSTLGEICFEDHNIVPIGGVSYVFEQLFGVKDKQLSFPTLKESSMVIGPDNSNSSDSSAEGRYETYQTPDGVRSVIYRPGHFVQLYGIGITGTAENDISIYDCDYLENSIELTRQNADGLEVNGIMLPFRYTPAALNELDRKKYFGKRKNPQTGVQEYFLKRFETDPVIKHIWKTGEDMEEQLIQSSDILSYGKSGTNNVESFIECTLKISRYDVKEYFRDFLQQPSRCRYNTIALFNGRYIKNSQTDDGDYQDVRLFSKLCINPEYLDLNKDLNIIYRVYGS